MSFHSTPSKSSAPSGQRSSTPFRSASISRFRSSLVPTSRPSPTRRSNPPTKPVSTSVGGRDLFRTATPRSQRTAEFAPDLPAEATRQSASVRKFAPRKSVSTGMLNTSSTELFKMRIPSPGPELTGRRLAKEVPNDPNRTGSIYADQFLAHFCPPHFDEVQRRQFFCILDLRRLKYAADEIFAQKDWKLNILNFAKEYEKSRGLIMLRYGLYEFKNVKPSKEVLKKWRSAHGLPPEPEENQTPARQSRRTPGPPGSVKRKAEEELASKDNTLMASTANQNKRRNLAAEIADPTFAVPAPFKGKRKAGETGEIDENKPSKQLKPTPSAATTFLENILNTPRNGGASPLKQSSQATSIFGITKTKDFAIKANPSEPVKSSSLFGASKTNGSVLSGHEIGSTPENTGNIFRYLSASPSSGSDEENDDDDHKPEPQAKQNAEKQSLSASITTNTTVPPVRDAASPFVVDKTNNTSDPFGKLSQSTSQSARGGLFGRVQMGADGQPVRANPGPDTKQDAHVNQPSTTKEQAAKTPATKPGDYTFNPATTPISFGQSALNVSKSSDTKDTSNSANSGPSVPKKSVSIFGASSQVSSEPKLNASSLFGTSSSTNPKSTEPSVSIFTSQKPTLTSTSILGTTSSVDTTKLPSKSNEQTKNAPLTTEKQSVSIFDKPATSSSTTSEAKSHPSNVDTKTTSSTPAAKSQVPSIFDKSFIANNAAQAKALPDNAKPSPDLFSRNANPLFGATKDVKAAKKGDTKDEKVDLNKPTTKASVPSIFDKSFIASNAAQAKPMPSSSKPSPDLFSRNSNPLFGAPKSNGTSSADTKSHTDQGEKQLSSTATPNNKPVEMSNDGNKDKTGSILAPTSNPPAVSIFGASTPKLAAPTASVFGASTGSKPAAPTTSIFSASTSSKPAAPTAPIFGVSTGSKLAAPTASIFGASTSAAPAAPTPSIFGAPASSQSAAPNSSIFGASANSKSVAPTPAMFGAPASSQSVVSTPSPFGGRKADESTKPAVSIFNSAPTANGPIFGFASQTKSDNHTQSTASNSTAAPKLGASFDTSTSHTNGTDLKKVSFEFGSSTPSVGSASFTFGQDTSSSSGFTFSAGASNQAVNNPFSASQSSPQLSGPIFGGRPATPNASSSFSHSPNKRAASSRAASPLKNRGLFGRSVSSTPKAAAPAPQGPGLFGSPSLGAPSVSLTQATPSQSPSGPETSNPTTSFSSIGLLQASDGSTVANSSFPAPSSIGTTPVNGTPEPQSPREDGEEAAHEQIKLTEGGPGEEDETVLHEVRAKVLKFIPVDKRDEDKKEAPWVTQGVGPLRVLKNKATGTVRIVLRAEPRGHIAINRTILADVEYKATEKTINLVSAGENGSGLETWLLQVKKPEFALALATVLEANKSANKQ